MRLFLAFLVVALAAGGALAIYSYASETPSYDSAVRLYSCADAPGGLRNRECGSLSLRRRPHPVFYGTVTVQRERRAMWAGPVALVLVVAGIGGGVAIAASGRR